jgi:hypothetical protein
MFEVESSGYRSIMLRIHPVRRLAYLAMQAGLSTWLWNNRADVAKRVKTMLKGDPIVPDPSRPIGDRFVPPIAGPGPTPFEDAKAEEAPLTTLGVQLHEETANSHVSIAIET